VQLEIRGHDFPGRTWANDGKPCENVHVGIQIGREPAELVPGDAEQATWRTDVEVVDRDGTTDFRGPAVQGKRGERFVYLCWGDLAADGTFTRFRRAKLMLDDVAPAAGDPDGHVVVSVGLTDDAGGPRSARLRPPAFTISPG
jgi:hypothetical protein